MIVANTATGQLLEEEADPEHLDQLPGSYWELRAIGDEPLCIGRPNLYTMGMRGLEESQPGIEGKLQILGTGAIRLYCNAPHGLIIETILPDSSPAVVAGTALP